MRSDAVNVLGGEVTLNTTKDTTVAKQDDHALTNLVGTLKENDLFNTSTSLKVPLIHAIEEFIRFKQCCDCKKKDKARQREGSHQVRLVWSRCEEFHAPAQSVL